MKILILLIILASLNSFAGGGTVGNGGTGVACYTEQKNLKSVELFDLWEAQGLERLSPLPSIVDPFQLATVKIHELEQIVSDIDGVMNKKLVELIQRMEMLPSGFRLALTGDINTILSPAAGCEFVQIINFSNNGRVFVVSDFWGKLDNVHKAALLVHEVIYWYLRESSSFERDSSRARRIVSLVFASEKLEKAMRNPFIQRFQCSEDNNSHITNRFWIYNDENNKLRIEFYYTMGKINFDRTSMIIEDDPASNLFSLEDFTKPGTFGITGHLNSRVDRDYNFSVIKEDTVYSLYIENAATKERLTNQLLCWLE